MADQEALDQFLQKAVERLVREGYLRASEGQPFHDPTGGSEGPAGPPVKFELTQKTIDFLGYRALRDLLGSVGKASFGRHDTRDLATGVLSVKKRFWKQRPSSFRKLKISGRWVYLR